MYKVNTPSGPVVVDFESACEIKGLPKNSGKPKKRKYATGLRDRINPNFPSKSRVVNWLGIEVLPDNEDDIQPSSQHATISYIKAMYPQYEPIASHEGIVI